MQQITEQQILAMAPNPAAASNGRKISLKGGFVRRECSADDTFYLGECTGSGKSNYITTADFIDPKAPVIRCSCPSRQFPCKHGLALLYEIMAKKQFATCEIPEDILKKREKKLAREAKAEQVQAAEGASPDSAADSKAGNARKSSSRASSAARTKKMKKQLEGLALTARLVQDLLKTGLGTMGGASLETYRQLSRQLGDYYLPGPQRMLNGLILEIAAFQKDGEEAHYEAAVKVLEALWSLVKKSEKYLKEKLEKGDSAPDDNSLYEELGGIWKLSELSALGLSRQNVELVQLAFWVTYDEARKEYIDTGCWAEPATGEICMTYNYRPLKALKYVKQEDSLFGVVQVPQAAYYPGDGNKRVRWEGTAVRPLTADDLAALRKRVGISVTMQSAEAGKSAGAINTTGKPAAAYCLGAEAKAAKNYLKNALADPMLIRLIPYEQIGTADGGMALRTFQGETIALGDMPGMEPTLKRLSLLPDAGLLKGQVMAGAFYYDASERRLKVQPLSILTEADIVRLLY